MVELATERAAAARRSSAQEQTGGRSLYLELLVDDRETIEALLEYAEGPERQRFAAEALRLGILALRHVGQRVDADLIGRETSRMLDMLQLRLEQHTVQVHDRLTVCLREYFDPESGRFHERVRRLVEKDGDLEQVLRNQVGRADSELARTLAEHFGEESPLMKALSPDQSQGVLALLRGILDEQLRLQRDRLIVEFSLDNKEGALARLVGELSGRQGELGKALQEKIDEVVREFSLDEENSALSRLVRNVDAAQRTIRSEFSLDNPDSAFSRLHGVLMRTEGTIDRQLTLDHEDSPLARLKRELFGILESQARENNQFREEVKVALGKLTARREESQRSTRHGLDFEQAVCQFVLYQAQAAGDVATATGHETGRIKNCKVGDCLLELGPDSPAPGARIVVEAKQDTGCSLAKAREEIERGRANRDAQLGLFVFSHRTAPAGLEPFIRLGCDLFVVWDAEDPASDVFLKAALTTARALAVRGGRKREAQEADFESLERAILEIEKRCDGLQEITRSAETIHGASEKIIDRVRITRKELARQIEILEEKIADLKGSLDVDAPATEFQPEC